MTLEDSLCRVLLDPDDLEVHLEVLLGKVPGDLGERRVVYSAHDLRGVLGGGLTHLGLAEVSGKVDIVPVLPSPLIPDGPRQVSNSLHGSMS